MSPPTSRRPRRAEVRERLLEAAARVVAERGVAAASLDQVAAAAGFTKGAVYSNFANKDELVLALMEEATRRRVAAVLAAASGAADLRGAVAAVGAALARPDPDAVLLATEFWARAVRDPAARAAWVAARRRLHDEVTAVVAGFLAERGARSRRDPAVVASVLLALGHGLALEAVADPGSVPAELAGEVLAALLGEEAG